MNSSSPARLMRSASVIALLAITVGCTTTGDGPSVAAPVSAAKESAQQARMSRLLRFCERLRGSGDLAVAVGLCARAHEIDPTDIEPLLELATTLDVMGRQYEASEAYRRALTIDANDRRALFGLGKVYMEMRQYEMAQRQFEAMLQRDDGDHRVYNILGVVNDLRGDHQAAQAYYRSGLKIASGDRTLRSNLGLSLSLSGDHDGAITMLGGFANDPAAGATSRQNLALAYGFAGDRSAAENIGRIDLSPDAVARNLAFYDANRTRGLAISDITNAPPATPQPLVSSVPLADDGRPIANQATAEAVNSAAAQIAPAAMPEPAQSAVMPEPDESAAMSIAPEPTGFAAFWPLDLPDYGGTEMTRAKADAGIRRHDFPAPEPMVIAQSATMTETPFNIGPPAKHVAAPPAKPAEVRPPVLRLSPDIDAIIAGSTGARAIARVRDHTLPAPESMIVAAGTPAKIETQVAAADTAPEIATDKADAADGPLFTLQLGSYLDAERSRQAWRDIVAIAPDLLADMEPVIQPAAIGTDQGAFYRLQTTPIAGRIQAEKVCAALQAQALYCVIAQATPDPGKLALVTIRTAPATESGIVAKVRVDPGIAVDFVQPATEMRTDRAARAAEWQLTGGGESLSSAAPPNDEFRYHVQLGSFRQIDRATLVWRQLESKAPELLTDLGYSVERADLGGEKGVYYRLRTGSMADRSTANALCTELQGRDIDCLVVRGSADDPAPSRAVDAGFETTKSTEGSTDPAASRKTDSGVKTSALKLDPTMERYSVQFGAYRNAEELRQNWRQFKELAPNLLEGIDPVVQRVATNTGGSPIFQLRTEQLAGRNQAERLCTALQERGVDCVVVGLAAADRNRPSPATVN